MIDLCCKIFTHTFYNMYGHNSRIHKVWVLLYLVEGKLFNFIIPIYLKIIRLKSDKR